MQPATLVQDSEESKTQFKFEGAHQSVTFGRCGARLEESHSPSSQITFMGLNIREQVSFCFVTLQYMYLQGPIIQVMLLVLTVVSKAAGQQISESRLLILLHLVYCVAFDHRQCMLCTDVQPWPMSITPFD